MSLRLRCPVQVARLLLVAALVLPLSVFGVLIGPWSPLALARADRLAREGDAVAALSLYTQISRFSVLEDQRSVALYRAGVSAADAELHQRAVHLLNRFVKEYPQRPERSRAWAQIGALMGGPLENPLRGARSLERAADLESDPVVSADLLLDAADLFERAELPSRAFKAAERASNVPERRASALTRMARLRLTSGDSRGAQELYERALNDPNALSSDLSLARLGLSMALEDQGQLGAAADVALLEDDPSLQQRRARVLSRQNARVQ